MSQKVQDGAVIDYTLSSTKSKGDLVAVGNRVGILLAGGVSGDVVACALDGVWDLPKVDAAVIALYEQVSFDVSAGKIDDASITPAAGDITLCGIAMEAMGATTDARIQVLLSPGGTIN